MLFELCSKHLPYATRTDTILVDPRRIKLVATANTVPRGAVIYHAWEKSAVK